MGAVREESTKRFGDRSCVVRGRIYFFQAEDGIRDIGVTWSSDVCSSDLRVQAATVGESRRAEQLKRLDGIATILATSAVRDAGLMALLAEDAVVSDAARSLTRDMLRAVGIEPPVEEPPPPAATTAAAVPERGVVPQSVISRQLANPFLAPDFSAAPRSAPRPGRLSGWELLGPLLSSFERAGGGDSACMPLPPPTARRLPGGAELMPHQAQPVAAAADRKSVV